MSQQPTFPALLFLQECGVLHFRTEAELRSQPIDFRLSNMFSGDSLIDSDGVEWLIDAIAASKVSIWQRVRHMSRGDQYRTVQVEYRRIGKLSIRDLRNRTLVQIDRDPGDVMMQFVEEEDLRAGVRRADNIQGLIEFLRKAESDEVYSESGGA